jgi:hypothetical protein
VNKVSVYVATTEGAVQVERIVREPAPRSAVCLGRTTRVLAISQEYDAFVKPPSGIIERDFGPFEPGAFRTDLSAAIDTGESWQLGIYVAHALARHGRLAAPHERADQAILLTGRMDCDGKIMQVSHIREKLTAAGDAVPMTFYLPQANAGDLPDPGDRPSIAPVTVDRADAVLRALHVPKPGAAPDTATAVSRQSPPRPGWQWAAMLFGLVAAATLLAGIEWGGWRLAADLRTAVAGTWPQTQPLRVVPANVPGVDVIAPTAGVRLRIFERRTPSDSHCAGVHFSRRPAADGVGTLCGLTFSITATDKPVYVGLHLAVESGRPVSFEAVPESLTGATLLSRSITWPVNLPLRRGVPYVYRIVVLAGPEPLTEDLERLADSADPDPVLATLQAKGMAVLSLRHRVDD